jgi:hypothetical protein
MRDARFQEKFLTAVSVMEQYGGTIGRDQGAGEDKIDKVGYTQPVSVAETTAASEVSRNKFLAMAFLHAVYKLWYGKLLTQRA